jgi:hypothetical protein
MANHSPPAAARLALIGEACVRPSPRRRAHHQTSHILQHAWCHHILTHLHCIALSHLATYAASTRTHASPSPCTRMPSLTARCASSMRAHHRSRIHSHTPHMHVHIIICIQSRRFVECASSRRADLPCTHSVAAERTYARCELIARRVHSILRVRDRCMHLDSLSYCIFMPRW